MKLTKTKDRWLQALAGLIMAAIGGFLVYWILPFNALIFILKVLGVFFGVLLVVWGICFACDESF